MIAIRQAGSKSGRSAHKRRNNADARQYRDTADQAGKYAQNKGNAQQTAAGRDESNGSGGTTGRVTESERPFTGLCIPVRLRHFRASPFCKPGRLDAKP